MRLWPFFLLGIITPLAAQQVPQQPPAYLDPTSRTTWRSTELNVLFSYPGVWKEVEASHPGSRVVITWRTQTSRSLIATCYLEAQGPAKSDIARLGPKGISDHAEQIALSYLENMRKRAPDAKLLTYRSIKQDGHPAVYMEREGTVESLDRKDRLRLYSITTSWRNHEINFECGNPFVGPSIDVDQKSKMFAGEVEKAIKNVLRTLQFVR